MIYPEAFNVVYSRSAHIEGAFQNDPRDRGNWTGGRVGKGELKGTKKGISAMSYPHLDIKNLSDEGIKAIYYVDWWQMVRLENLSTAVNYQLFDAAINHGAVSAKKMLQRAVGAHDDGIIGPKTMKLINATTLDDLLLRFLAQRLHFMSNISTWNVYGRGWARRIAKNLRYASLDN